ncbi:hypothetical protein MCOR14_003508 [Pyricularia oryzae]|nr:hypothetical protein MCOR14_003508 [Pyricularia oryzae]
MDRHDATNHIGTALRSPDWAAQLVRGGAVACNTSISVVVSILLLGIDYFDVVLHSMGNRLRGLLGAASWTSTVSCKSDIIIPIPATNAAADRRVLRRQGMPLLLNSFSLRLQPPAVAVDKVLLHGQFTARPAYYTLIGQLAMQELSYDSDRV